MNLISPFTENATYRDKITAAVKVKHIKSFESSRLSTYRMNEEDKIMCVSDIESYYPRELNFFQNRSFGFYREPNMMLVNFPALLINCERKSVVQHLPSCLFTVDFHASLPFPSPLLIASVSFLSLWGFHKEGGSFFSE